MTHSNFMEQGIIWHLQSFFLHNGHFTILFQMCSILIPFNFSINVSRFLKNNRPFAMLKIYSKPSFSFSEPGKK